VFDVPVIQLRQRSSQLEYEISDGDERPIGEAVQVAGPAPRKGVMSMFGSGLGDARVVVRVDDAGGRPVCYVDHKPKCPVAIVSAGGAVLGRYDTDLFGMSRQGIRGSGFLSPVVVPMCDRLLDAQDRSVCRLVWKQMVRDQRRIPESARYRGVDDEPVAELDYKAATHKDRYRLELAGPLPEPLRTLVAVSPLAFDLRES
jgi:hypothetical protein